ncbi:hypothetical protein TYRP_004679 [Tyrophagus putrescentiae]|nr:hypothetical protein TYRP_004679 [Tyrophagus putrescentiae]
MMQNKLVFLLVIAVFVCLFHLSWADDKKDMVLIGGEHGCGPKLLYKSGGKKKGDFILMNDCKQKHQEYHFVPYPIYYHTSHGYGGGDHGGGYGGY